MPLESVFEVGVYGLTVNPGSKPLLLFKSKGVEQVFPIWLSESETAILLKGGGEGADNPHRLSLDSIKALGGEPVQATLMEIKNFSQKGVLNIQPAGGDQALSIDFKAETAISFILSLRCPLFATQKFMDQCRRTTIEFQLPSHQKMNESLHKPGLLQ